MRIDAPRELSRHRHGRYRRRDHRARCGDRVRDRTGIILGRVLRVFCSGVEWRASSVQRILVDLAVLHDDLEVLGGSAIRLMFSSGLPSTSSRSASAPCFHDAELARIGIALAGQRQQFGVGRRRHDERFGGGVPTDKRGQNCPLLLRQRAGEQDIGAPRRLDLVLLRQLVGPGYAGPDLIRLGSLDRAHRKAQPQVLGERLHAQPNALLGDQFGGCFVHQEAVFDTLHASRNGPLGSQPA